MKSKLRANKDYYETKQLRIAYIESRIADKAAAYLALRILEEVDDRFTTANKILRHLKAVYHDPNKLQNTKYEFK